MDDNLAGYVLKALDDDDQRQVEAALRESPELRSRLELLERALSPLEVDLPAAEPPPGLLLATLARIAEHQCRKLPDAPQPPRSQSVPSNRSWLRRPDVLVAALLLITLGVIGSSALVHLWRDYYGRAACRANLARIWSGLRNYCDHHNGNFPLVEEDGSHGVAGIFVPILSDSGVLSPEVRVNCPAQEALPRQGLSVGDMEKLYERDRQAFREQARKLTGGYAYTLGYFDSAGFHGLRRDSGDHLPILADRLDSLTQLNSNNHGGDGQNVLYLGGHAQWHGNRKAGINGDDIFVNWDNELRAGNAREDTVLGPGDASPIPRE